MRKKEVINIAVNRGLEPGKHRKWELIRAIQRAEGNTDCYRTSVADNCEQIACLWRKDCLEGKTKP
ncbi:MAG: SAP domain-containing protein [Sedimenticola sp.]